MDLHLRRRLRQFRLAGISPRCPFPLSLSQAYHPDRVRVFGGVLADAAPNCGDIASDARDVWMRLRCDRPLMMGVVVASGTTDAFSEWQVEAPGMPEAR